MLFSFDEFRLDTDKRELRQGARLIPVEPQVFDLIEYLIRNRERVVSKDDLIAAIWSGRIVSESALTTRINAARTAIGDSGKEQRLIRTLLRKGVRFVGSVREEALGTPDTVAPVVSERDPGTGQTMSMPAESSAIENVDSVAVTDPPTTRVRPSPKVSERRQLTVVQCQLVGPQAAAHALELEDLEDALDAYHRCVADTMTHFNGFVAQRIGNMALVCFGYPAAHEGDAEQAVRAALELCAMVKAPTLPGGQIWHSRAGIATGVVIVNSPNTDGDPQKLELVGDPLEAGARLQALAMPGTILIDQSTKQLIGDLFDCRDVRALDASGVREAGRAWQVLGPGTVESRFAALHPAGLTPLVGRDEEVELLVRRWEQATGGAEERVVLISGEPGIGKSRLIADLEGRLEARNYARLHYSCSPHHSDSAFHPFVAQLERSIQGEADNTPERKLARLEAQLAAAGMPVEDVALLADLLSLPTSGRFPQLNLGPQRKKELTCEALVHRIAGLARHDPVLMIVEDMHWIDPTSLDVVSLAIERLQSRPVLAMITFRTEFQPPWLGQPNVTMMSLTRLSQRESVAMVRQVARETVLPDGIVDEIVRRTDGMPLYIEELTKAVIEAGELPDGKAGWSLQLRTSAVPPTLQTSLMARLDRIGPAKQIAQVGAVIGREFSYELLSAVLGENEDELQSALDRLTETGLVFRRGSPPRSTYIFKHALIQDTAYSTLLRRRRQELHASIATALETRFADVAALQPEIVAHHLVQAGQPGRAVEYWIRAGDLASRRSVGPEAAGHYRAALRDISTQADDAMRQIEPQIYMKLANVTIQSEGYGSHTAIEAYRQAQTKAAALDRPEDYAKAAIGLAPLLFSGCRYQEVARTLEDISEKLLDQLHPHTRVHLFTMLAVANYCLGEFSLAWDRLDAAQALDQQSPCTHENPIAGADPTIVISNYMAMCGAVLGKLQEGLTATENALTIARGRNDAFTVAWALLGRLRALRAVDRFSEGIVCGEEAAEICERHGFPSRLGSVLMGCAVIRLGVGDVERGLADMRRGIELWRETSGNFHMSEWLSYLVDRLLHADHPDLAETLLADAERIVDQTDEKSHCAEIWRLRGNFLHRNGAVDEASSFFQRAIEWASPRSAKVFELRARLDMARLHLQTDRPDAATVVLKPAIALFPNDAEIADLQQARALVGAGR